MIGQALDIIECQRHCEIIKPRWYSNAIELNLA